MFVYKGLTQKEQNEEQSPERVSWNTAFEFELAALGPAARRGRLLALCLSGGGVRSAAYCLGVLQALAGAKRLRQCHYLSTVSGGGYIGAWLQTMIRRHGVRGAQERLARRDPDAPPGEDPPEVRRLRSYTNWLTPNGGLMSLDGWTGLAIYLRNVLLNWLVFGPLFLLAALVAVTARTGFFFLQPLPKGTQPELLLFHPQHPRVVASCFLLAGLVGLVWGTLGSCKGLPSRRPLRDGEDKAPDYWDARTIGRHIVMPSLLWAFCVPFALAPVWHWVLDGSFWARWALPLLFAGGSIAGYLGAALTRPAGTPPYWNNLLPWCAGSAAGALTLYAGVRLVEAGAAWARPPNDLAAEIMVIAGPAWLLLCHAVLSAVHAGLRGSFGLQRTDQAADALSDLDAEWMARITAARLRTGLAWAVFAFCVLTLERLATQSVSDDTGWHHTLTATLAAGPVAAWLGKQAFSRVDALLSGKPGLITWDVLLRAASLVFATAVLAESGVIVRAVLTRVQSWLALHWDQLWIAARWHPNPFAINFAAQALFGVAMAFIICFADTWIRTNRFSMHGMYRDRLVRAFVGPARAKPANPKPGDVARHADPFTGFDPSDNPPMCALTPKRGASRLFPVINATLNLSAPRQAEWADRKAAPFTLTPLHCGAAHLKQRSGQYVATAQYAGSGTEGISLGTAMAVSGAAVSPNWGYHSSSLTAFIMTLFNVRLGAWLPNPARRQGVVRRPASGRGLIWQELRGKTDDTRDYVYLSDGGHFDNLGIYEMLRRRCRLIAVVDATRDPDGGCADLGAVIGKARIDMGVRICTLPADPETGVPTEEEDGFSARLICYPDGTCGVLLLLRPVLTDDVPVDVRAYHARNDSFPNEATAEQWFTEAQFESHRALGEHQAGLALGRLRNGLGRTCVMAMRMGC